MALLQKVRIGSYQKFDRSKRKHLFGKGQTLWEEVRFGPLRPAILPSDKQNSFNDDWLTGDGYVQENLIEDGHMQNRIPENGIPRNLVDQWKHVQDNLTKMEVQNQRNKDFKEKQVQFAIQLYENDEEFDCHFSLYKGGTLLTDKLERFPCPPTAVRIRSSSNAGKKATSLKTICVEWDYEDVGYPFELLVQYRQKNNSDERWIQKKTTTSSICLASGPAMEVRVAMDTCIGRSDFSPSPVLFVPTVRNQRPPTVKSVMQTNADFKTPKSRKTIR